METGEKITIREKTLESRQFFSDYCECFEKSEE